MRRSTWRSEILRDTHQHHYPGFRTVDLETPAGPPPPPSIRLLLAGEECPDCAMLRRRLARYQLLVIIFASLTLLALFLFASIAIRLVELTRGI
jgi:hypothetical protein